MAKNLYTCPNCKATWTEDEIYADCDDNEDQVVMLESCGMCPECWTGDNSDILNAQATDVFFD